jgi:hypothetical protein
LLNRLNKIMANKQVKDQEKELHSKEYVAESIKKVKELEKELYSKECVAER